MSRNAIILEKAAVSANPAVPPVLAAHSPSEYADLIRNLFEWHAVLAVIESGAGSRASEACRGIAAELAASGQRVVIVQVNSILRLHDLPDTSACLPGRVPNVSLWPAPGGAPVEFFPSPTPGPAANWLASLRRDFNAVLLECPSIETTPAAATIAAQADAAVLVVEAGQTTKQQIQRDQKTLQLRGVKLAGCVLMRRR